MLDYQFGIHFRTSHGLPSLSVDFFCGLGESTNKEANDQVGFQDGSVKLTVVPAQGNAV